MKGNLSKKKKRFLKYKAKTLTDIPQEKKEDIKGREIRKGRRTERQKSSASTSDYRFAPSSVCTWQSQSDSTNTMRDSSVQAVVCGTPSQTACTTSSYTTLAHTGPPAVPRLLYSSPAPAGAGMRGQHRSLPPAQITGLAEACPALFCSTQVTSFHPAPYPVKGSRQKSCLCYRGPKRHSLPRFPHSSSDRQPNQAVLPLVGFVVSKVWKLKNKNKHWHENLKDLKNKKKAYIDIIWPFPSQSNKHSI